VVKRESPQKYTIWNAPASASVPALDQLDMDAPLTWTPADKKRIARRMAKTAAKYERAFAPSRFISESLRKVLK
jgi:hypothetical protein